jgi:hypothetical protein
VKPKGLTTVVVQGAFVTLWLTIEPLAYVNHVRKLERKRKRKGKRVATMDKLGFKLELRGKTWVVAEDEGGIRPATNPEVALWKALETVKDDVKQLLKLAYIGEHYFSDLTWKARCDELLLTVAALKALLDTHRIPYTLQEEASPVCESCKPGNCVCGLGIQCELPDRGNDNGNR